MGYKAFIATAATAALIGTGASAALVSIDQIDGMWINPMGGSSVTINTNGNTEEIRWGTSTGQGQSGYDFTPESPLGFTLAPSTPTVLGTFVHLNRPIQAGGAIDSVQLDFTFGGAVLEDAAGNPIPLPGIAASFGAVFDFTHDETTNTGTVGGCDTPPQQSGVPCDDVVTVAAQGGASETVVVDGSEYTFTLLGFSIDGGATFSNQFVTTEGLDNSADLYFEYTARVVPLPAAGWLLLAGIGALGAAGRRRKKSV